MTFHKTQPTELRNTPFGWWIEDALLKGCCQVIIQRFWL